MRGKEQLPEPGSHTGVSEPIRADQNFDLNVLNDFILNELQEGEITELHPCDFTNIQIGEIRDQLMDQIPGWAVAPTELMDSPPLVTRAVALPQLVGRGTAPPQLVSRGVAPPQLIDRGVAPPQLVSRGTGPPQLASRGTGPPQLASRGTGPPQLVSRGTGAPQLVSRGTGSPQVAGKDAGPPDARRKTTTATGRGGRAMATSRLVSRNFTRPFLNVSVKGEPPKLVITEQPKQRGMRFRYECEGRSAGSIPGENTTENNKTLPTIQIQNWQGEVKVVISLVTKGDPYKPHPHSLVGKDCHDGICEVVVSPKCNMKASFANLGIQCMKKKEVGKAVEQRLKLGIDPFNDFQFSANAEAVQTFTKKEGEEFAELFTWGQGSKPWSCFGREYAAAATCYRDGPFAGLQDGGLYGDPCYLKDEPADASGYGGFYGQAVEAGGDCREAEALRPALDVAYSALMAVDNLGAVPSEDDEEDLTDYVFNMGFAGGGGGGEALSAILGSSIALPSDQAGSKG
uniref:uncharacterized protein n=1 Tax=Pristiophorus japonicus TaxID=55135 RepID=UPI00398EF42C